MSVSFTKFTNISLKEKVLQELENKILSGELQPGERLPPERDMASAMGISRSLINLCILELESRGFVRIVPRQGTFVADYKKHGTPQILLSLMHYDIDKMDWTLFDSMMDTRQLIEYECTRLAIKNATQEDIESIREALGGMEKNIDSGNFLKENFRFHQALTAASGNAVYAMILNSFEHALIYFLKIFFCNAERREASLKNHQDLFKALCERNKAEALETIHRIFDTGIKALSNVFKR